MESRACTYSCLMRSMELSTAREMQHSPEARPSIPSIRFMALVIYTTIRSVRGMPNHDGIS